MKHFHCFYHQSPLWDLVMIFMSSTLNEYYFFHFVLSSKSNVHPNVHFYELNIKYTDSENILEITY